jgi:transposase-like protein
MQIQPNKRLLKKRRNLVKRKDTDLWSLDECHFQQHGTRVAMWVPPEEKDPVVLLAPTRKSVSLFGAVNVNDGRLVTRFEKQFDAMTFKAFLIQLLRHRKKGKRIVVMLDNARYHHAKILHDFLRKNRKVLRLEFLPAYSPELNPIERVWKLTRRICTHNVYFEKLEQVTYSVTKQHDAWKKPNEALRRLCCIT